ncbi:MobF family relaxase [Ferrimicrobium sp.]|uniref:MobF family relaxase n=1 Tax=Ferrimicrobium sp. TaxID=2926050 RepID=UPI002613140E|nr:MobF family relaxase [Ferrimicrobium sp.]
MRLFKIRGSLDYYIQRELSDEVGGVQRYDVKSQSDHQPFRSVEVADLSGAATSIRHPIKALDFTIAAPKAVSIRWALAPESERIPIERAHHDAVRRTFELMLEFDAAKVIRGDLSPVEQVVAYDVGHRLSRSGDPHLHSHLVVLNNVVVDGRNVALEHAQWARGLPVWELCYRTELAHELRKLGIELTGRGLDSWHVVGQPEELGAVFSKRRSEVLRLAGDQGSGRIRQLAVLCSRKEKVPRSQSELRARWESEAQMVSQDAPIPSLGVAGPGTGIRVNDPLLNELARAIENGATDIKTAREVALSASFGAMRAKQLMNGEETMVAGKGMRLDGSLCLAYRSLPVAQRLALMEAPAANLQEVYSSREVIPMVEALEQFGLRAGDRLAVATRTPQEAALITGFGQYRQSPHGPTLVVDANALAPSELSELVASGRTVVRTPGKSCLESPVMTMLGLRGDEGKTLILAESSVALWKAFVADCVSWVQSGCQESVSFSTPSPGLSAKLRREVGLQIPEAVAGHLGSKPLFRGEPVTMPDGRSGRIVELKDMHLTVQMDATTEIVPTRHPIHLEGFSLATGDRRTVRFGDLPSRDAGNIERIYLCQPELSELTQHLNLTIDRQGVNWLRERPTITISRARRAELAKTNGRFQGEKLYQLRAITNTLSRIYDRAEELGLDDRRGRDRIIEEQLGLSRDRDPLGRGRSL